MSFQIIADLQKVAAKDGKVVTVPDGEVLNDGQGGSFKYFANETDTPDDPLIGANNIKPNGIVLGENGIWRRRNSDSLLALSNQVAMLQSSVDSASINVDRKIAGNPGGFTKSPQVLTAITASATIAKANTLSTLGTITTDQIATRPDATKAKGKPLYIYVSNTGAGRWTIAGYGKVRTGKLYSFLSNGTIWIDIGNVKNVEIHTPTTGQTITFAKDALNIVISNSAFTVAGPTSPNYLDTFGVEFALTTSTITWPSSFTTTLTGTAKSNYDFVWDGSHWN